MHTDSLCHERFSDVHTVYLNIIVVVDLPCEGGSMFHIKFYMCVYWYEMVGTLNVKDCSVPVQNESPQYGGV